VNPKHTEGQDVDDLQHLDLDDPADRRAARVWIAVDLLSSQQNILGGLVQRDGVRMTAVNRQYVAAALLLADEVLSQGDRVEPRGDGLKLAEIDAE
jgi:hypothetical protein